MARYEPSPQLRASDADREATVERLRVAAIEGRLDADELDERLTAAYRARLCAELERLTADVTPPPLRRAAPRPVAQRPRSLNRLALASLITGLFWWWFVGSVAAIVMGHIALRQIDRSQGTQYGRPLAVAGLTLGYLALIMALIFGGLGLLF